MSSNPQIKVPEEDKFKKIISFPPQVAQQYKKLVGMYGATFGVNKYFHLFNAIHLGIAQMHRDDPTFIYEVIADDLKKLKDYEKKTGNKTFYSHVGEWNNIYDKLKVFQKDLWTIQQTYDDLRIKKLDSRKDPKSFLRYKKASKKVNPYSPELYYLFIMVNKFTNMQMMVIPNEYYKSPEMSEIQRNPFIRGKPQQQQNIPQQTDQSNQNPQNNP